MTDVSYQVPPWVRSDAPDPRPRPGPHGGLALVAGTANRALARELASELGVELAAVELSRFPDGEMQIAVPPGVRGRDVYLVQPTGPPGQENLFELLMLADASHRSGAARITAVVPYLGYARQDRRRAPGEALGLRVVADLVASSRIDRLMVVDPHTTGLEAVFGIPVEGLTAVPMLAARLAHEPIMDGVIVAPDLGAVKLAEAYAALLDLPVAVARKTRRSGARVTVAGVVGDVRDRTPVIVDDMITTAATIDAAAGALIEAGSRPEFVVAATHGVLVGPAFDRLQALGPSTTLVTNTLALSSPGPSSIDVCSVAPLLADAIRQLHRDRPIEELSLAERRCAPVGPPGSPRKKKPSRRAQEVDHAV